MESRDRRVSPRLKRASVTAKPLISDFANYNLTSSAFRAHANGKIFVEMTAGK